MDDQSYYTTDESTWFHVPHERRTIKCKLSDDREVADNIITLIQKINPIQSQTGERVSYDELNDPDCSIMKDIEAFYETNLQDDPKDYPFNKHITMRSLYNSLCFPPSAHPLQMEYEFVDSSIVIKVSVFEEAGSSIHHCCVITGSLIFPSRLFCTRTELDHYKSLY